MLTSDFFLLILAVCVIVGLLVCWRSRHGNVEAEEKPLTPIAPSPATPVIPPKVVRTVGACERFPECACEEVPPSGIWCEEELGRRPPQP